jgi:hypothetical protein
MTITIALPTASADSITASNRGTCKADEGFGICQWASPFPTGQTLAIELTTTPRIVPGKTTPQVCASANRDLEENVCVDATIRAPRADLEIELFSAFSRDREFVAIRVVVTNNGPDASPSARYRLDYTWTTRLRAIQRAALCKGTQKWFTCPVGKLEPGSSVSRTVDERLYDSVKTFASVGTVTGSISDPKPGNNRDTSRAMDTG